MAYNEDLDPPPPQDISNLFAAADLSSRSSSDSAKYKRAWLKAKLIHSYIYLLGDVQTHAVDNYPLQQIIKKLDPLWLVTGPFPQTNMPMQLPKMKK